MNPDISQTDPVVLLVMAVLAWAGYFLTRPPKRRR